MNVKSINNFDLTEYNAYRLSAVCSRAWFPNSEEEVKEVYSSGSKESLIIIGNGNNIILSKPYYSQEFVIFNRCFDKVSFNNQILEAEAGATLLETSEIALKYNLSGLEIFYDIPSSVGGAVVMNAGTKEGEIKDIIQNVRYLDLVDMQLKERGNREINFEYRNSFFQRNSDKIVLKAWFKLRTDNSGSIKERMEKYKQTRWAKQPREYPNCGSVFKRPPGFFVGAMIDELGMKGFSIGGAKISEKHSGFIINTGNATGQDILTIVSEVQRRVKNHFGVDLVIEQRII